MRLFIAIVLFFYVNTSFAVTTVYQCKDSRGRKVFQQVPCHESRVLNDGSDAHVLWKKMRTLSEDGKNILADLTEHVDSVKACNKRIDFFKRKVSVLDGDVKRLNKKYAELRSAQSYLKDCGVCRTSAEANCRTADRYLEKAVAKLTEY